ncbi:MAG: ATPase, T2SS/T4P/T4SS family [Desulfurivibrio sp.]|nr:ATPase, T2SS/T4P/T4SS family [Desulfurivibrio sp.]
MEESLSCLGQVPLHPRKDQWGNTIIDGNGLAKLLAKEADMEYSEEELPVVYGAVKKKLGERIFSILENKFKHCQPSEEYLNISKFPWARIYTLNIDDALDRALLKNSPQKVNIRNRTDKVFDPDQLFQKLDYIKLNGSVDRVDKGLIFSVKDYGKTLANTPLWYKELAEDYFKFVFLFIGTKLKESVFYHQVERCKIDSESIEQRSYLLTPDATQIEKSNLLSGHNIEHIPCTLGEFSKWLKKTFPTPPTPNDLAIKTNPALEVMLGFETSGDRERYVKIFENVINISRSNLSSSLVQSTPKGKIRPFYKGFKPTWFDILEDVPAELKATQEVFEVALKALKGGCKLIVVSGPAGSGKTTLLKQVALKISENEDIPVYYIEQPVDILKEIVNELEKINSNKYLLVCDRLDVLSDDVEKIIDDSIINKGVILSCESQKVWESRTKYKLGSFCKEAYSLTLIEKTDAKSILQKIEKFGPWTRLGQLSESQRIKELVEKAKRQLLIGLFEATSGIGFEKIIENEYSSIKNEEERALLILVGFATMHKVYISDFFIKRALTDMGIDVSVATLANQMSGIISYDNGKLFARHPVYIRHLFDQLINCQSLHDCLCSLLTAYTVYEAPVIRFVNKNEGILFKSIINHNFMKDILRGDSSQILNIYESFEKIF